MTPAAAPCVEAAVASIAANVHVHGRQRLVIVVAYPSLGVGSTLSARARWCDRRFIGREGPGLDRQAGPRGLRKGAGGGRCGRRRAGDRPDRTPPTGPE